MRTVRFEPNGHYRLTVPCMACNREKDWPCCKACSDAEDAERAAGNYPPSPQLEPIPDA